MKSFLMLASLLSVSVAWAEDKKRDEEKIVGTWAMVSGEKGGEAAPENFVKSFRLTFKGEGKLTANSKGNHAEGTFKLDAAKKPSQLDISLEGKSITGIYELDGDTLKLCVTEGGERPGEFKSPQGSKVMVMVLKRQK